MRNARLFAGTSHPALAAEIAARLGVPLADVDLDAHPNREVAVELGVSVRNQDIFVIQSGSDSANDHFIELLALVSACRSGGAWRVTVIVPYFPYGKSCKKKRRARAPVLAKLCADMLTMAGADHVITMDLHHEQMQGFFSRPVDNLLAEPTLCKFVAHHIPGYEAGVAVSKNPGGVKRVTSFADRLKIRFALIHRDCSVPAPPGAAAVSSSSSSSSSTSVFQGSSLSLTELRNTRALELQPSAALEGSAAAETTSASRIANLQSQISGLSVADEKPFTTASKATGGLAFEDDVVKTAAAAGLAVTSCGDLECPDKTDDEASFSNSRGGAGMTVGDDGDAGDNCGTTEEQSPNSLAGYSESVNLLEAIHSEWHKDGLQLVGDVRGRLCFILDDMIDQAESLIPVATLLVRKGATSVVLIATHGIFSNDALMKFENCSFISMVIVTNTYPISAEKMESSSKLRVIDVSTVLAEAIRRTHNGESISYLFHTSL